MPTRVLIISAGVGKGHVRAGEALEQAFVQLGAAREVRHVDALDYANRLYSTVYVKGSRYVFNRLPAVAASLYNALDRPWRNERSRAAFDRWNTRPLLKVVREYQPDLIVCTHFLPAGVLSSISATDRRIPRLTTVVTDFDVHALWLTRGCSHYFVASDQARAHLESHGVAHSHITVTGIPVHPSFSMSRNVAELRREHGLTHGRPAILVSAGRLGMSAVERIIDSLITLRRETEVIIVCSGNEELETRARQMVNRVPAGTGVTFRIVGFTDHMHELMAMSDVLIGRPGGLTTAEALASGLPMLIVNPIPGQEERNSDHLLEGGAALRCRDLSVLGHKLGRLLDDPNRLRCMTENAARMGRPRAALDVVATLLALSGEEWDARRDVHESRADAPG